MSELLRFHTPRNPAVISEKDYNKIAIESHPVGYRSKRFIAWADLCKKKDYVALNGQFAKFLGSEQSITSITDHNNPATKPDRRQGVAHFLQPVLRKGKSITTDDLVSSFGEARLRESKKLLFDAITRTADTFLAVVFLRITSNIKGISYQDHLKLLFALDLISASRKEHFRFNLDEYLARPVMLPPCFFSINRCTKKFESRASFFTPGGDFGTGPQPFEPAAREREDAPRLPAPDKDPCECEVDDSCQAQNPCCATIKPYVTDLMIVRDEIRCYVPGSISYIENVLMGENRTRRHRLLERTEDYTEQEIDRSNYTEKDHEATERYSLQKETSDTVQQDLKLHAGVTFTTTYGPKAARKTLTANFDSNYDWSKSEAHKVAENYSKDVIDRSITKVEEKMRTLVTQKRIVETEERNKHVFNNLEGKDNISGQYFFVDQVSRAQMYNWGKRLMIDLRLPEPSELYKRLLAKQFKFDLKEPVKPTIKPTDIGPDNYLDLALQYGIKDFEFPPKMTQDIPVHIVGHNSKKDARNYIQTPDYPISIPSNYVTTSMDWSVSILNWSDHGATSFGAHLGGSSLAGSHSSTGSQGYTNLPALEGAQSVSFYTWGTRLL